MNKKEQAIAWIKEEIRSLERAPELNGCPMTTEWAEQLEIMRTCLEAVSAYHHDNISIAEAAEAAQETLQRAMAEYKARAEKAERERDAAISTVNNAYRAGAITVKDPRFILPGVESKGWYRTVSVLGDQHVEPNKKVVFRFEDEVSKPSEDQWSWLMGRFMKGE